MANFLDTQSDARRFAQVMAEFEKRLQDLERTSQAGFTSIEGGSLDIYDADGTLRGSVGVQEDGAVAVVAVNSTPPPTPTAPTVEPVLAGLVVTWDGTWDDSYTTPTDYERMQVHVGLAPDFTPDATTLSATISNRAGGAVTVATATYDTAHVRLVAVNTASVTGPPSAAVAGTPKMVDGPDLSALLDLAVWLKDESVPGSKLVRETIGADLLAANSVVAGKVAADAIGARELKAQSVTAGKIAAGAVETPHISVGAVRPDQIAVGQGTNLVPDPSFESAATANTIAAGGAPWALAPGNRTGVGILCDCTADVATYFTLPLATVPVLPGAQFWLGTDILVSEDFAAQAVKILARWESVAGDILGYGVVEATTPEPGRWQRITGQVAAPQGTVQAVLCLEASAATRGWAVWDNAEATTIFGRVAGGARAEVGPQGVRLYDDTGEEAVSLVTGEPQFLTLRSGGNAVATIDDEGNASFADVNVAGGLTVGGEPISNFLGDRPLGMLAIDYQASSVTAGTSEIGFVELAFESEANRMYRIVFDATADPSVAGGEIQLRLRDGRTAKPTISSPQLQAATHPMPLATSQRVRLEWVGNGGGLGVGLHRLLITFRCSGGPSGQTVDLFGNSTMMGVLYVEDIGPHVPETGGYNTGGGTEPDPIRKYTKTYTASWSGSYANRSGYNSYYGNKCVQGYYSGTNGTQAALIGFPSALSSDLSGATILKAEVYLYADHWYYAAGGSAVIKAHSHASRPAKFSSDAEAKTISWRRNEGKWVDITSVFDSTKWRGIALDPNSTNRTYYGSFRGAGQSYPPKLRVTYTK
ncbi:hypothetical protein SEA_GILGAMESH_71 [Streptomyces phage Gilgamesh]|uniref:Minor tail protein n=1 Tax=Streptomyces phage Gilgamesh TaxID=2599890 RepID=A0A5J6TR36_9CAUD|nr:hypothetical protein QEH35_gp071 [Streptomyces phage Gilgamesh]QFG13263.1 hypothetical protein SEA_GILGAMESH_71 [Streptomyces phage Gilgamesh]